MVSDFGRPAVLHWTGVACHAGPARTAPPRAASRRLTPVPDLDSIEREAERLRELSRQDGVHTAALAVDPHHWQLVRFVLWAETSAQDADATERYEVLHLSAPALDGLPEGRTW
ncbi:DUF4865 family protein [Nonomuraea salmonea]|uniref:DUF4865 family protein n=1 Tax=Nonomuraea salmonea TaxID=46181 RepID=UPI003CD081CB